MKQRVIKPILFVVAASAILVGYQNCAKVKDLQTADSASKLGGADGTSSGGSTTGSSGGSTSGSSGGSTTGSTGGSTTGGEGSTTGSSGGSSTGGSEGGGATTGGGSEMPAPPLTPREKAYKDCEAAKAKAVNVSEFIDIMNYYGNRTIRLQNLGIVSNYTGNLKVVGSSEQNTARMLKDSIGNYLFCQMDLTAISNFKSGNVTVVGGDIGTVDGFYGNINVYGGRITGTVKNVTGNVDEEP